MSSLEKSSNAAKHVSGSHVVNDYTQRTYNELSQGFKAAFTRAFEFVPLMYNRLTMVDGLSHEDALTKMHDDHKHLPGFSTRNIYRYLPCDNINIPRRVMTPRHKNSSTETPKQLELSSIEQDTDGKVELVDVIQHHEDDFAKKENEFEFDPEHREEQNDDTVSTPQSSNSSFNKYDVVDFEIRLDWEYVRNYMIELYKSDNSIEVWFSGELDRRTGKVIAVYAGRKEDRNHISEEGQSIE